MRVCECVCTLAAARLSDYGIDVRAHAAALHPIAIRARPPYRRRRRCCCCLPVSLAPDLRVVVVGDYRQICRLIQFSRR